ncbi:CidA/LrgA family protein [Pseudogemmobacter sp. CC-YST710]|uniref:CidA/LrgA family protein n=2 Tax=Pseudogemmobacter faecipullorum TaxID=2755041 RepID=A0ABS8CGY1_9RHOB|nr:CidA/LrgA family protein [Pseudogemmobacter faecipullorum]
MIVAIIALLCCQLAGEIVSRSLGLPLPGPVAGMGLLLAGLMVSERLRNAVRPVAETILGNMMLLFVPAGVGAALQLPKLGAATWPLVLAVLVSTLAAIAVGALSFTLVARLTGNHDEAP